MVNPPKAHALNRRAQSASVIMKQCAEILSKALKEQTPPREQSGLGFLTAARVAETIVLKGKYAEKIAQELYLCANEIDKSTWPVKQG